MKTKRQLQIGKEIQRTLSQIMLREAEEPIFKKITIVDVEVSPDLEVAKVFVSVFDEVNVNNALEILKKKAGFFRHALAVNLNLRKTPRLHFIYDETIKRGQKLSSLIDQAIAEDTKNQHD